MDTMEKDFTKLLNRMSESAKVLEPTKPKRITYPFLWVEGVWDIEYKGWIRDNLFTDCEPSDGNSVLPLFQRIEDKYKPLGNLTFSCRAYMILNHYCNRDIHLKKCKDSDIIIGADLLSATLLGE